MSMKKEDYEEFQRQLELQNQIAEAEKAKIMKTDDDGTEYEWDEAKKAWFPKLSVDLMVQYHSNYEATDVQSNANDGESKDIDVKKQDSYFDPLSKTKYLWNVESKQWVPVVDKSRTSTSSYEYTDTATGQLYKWSVCDQKWHAIDSSEDNKTLSDGTATYTDPGSSVVYKWDTEKSLWVSDDGKILYPETSESHSDGDASTTQTDTNKSKPVGKKSKRKAKTIGIKRPAAEWFEVEDDKNTNVYVSGLPPDISQAEFSELMAKCGIIMVNPVTNEPKLKLYSDKDGNLKGDGLCCYVKKESVALAIQILDGMDFRGGYELKVQEACFNLKGSYDPSKKPKSLSKQEKKKLKKQTERMLDWKLARKEEQVTKAARVVILRNMFEVKEFEEDPVLITEIRDDLRTECEKFGPVKKVIVFDRHPDGVCSVAFKDLETAENCLKALNGRWFGGKKVEAVLWDGVTDYQIEETDREREVRLQKWEEFLKSEDKKSSDNVDTDNSEHKTSTDVECDNNNMDTADVDNSEESSVGHCKKSAVSHEISIPTDS